MKTLIASSFVFFVYYTFPLSVLGQNNQQYIQPEYKIIRRDTMGTFIQIINYFDRSYYSKDIFLKKNVEENGSQFILLEMDSTSKIAPISTKFSPPYTLQIGKTLEIIDIELEAEKLNIIEIRGENGFLSLRNFPSERIVDNAPKVQIFKHNWQDTIEVNTIPKGIELPMGKYGVLWHTLPKKYYTVNLNPSEIKHIWNFTPIPFRIICTDSSMEYNLYAAAKPYKVFKALTTGESIRGFSNMVIQPYFAYRLEYRKKNRGRFKSKQFYVSNTMTEMTINLDK